MNEREKELYANKIRQLLLNLSYNGFYGEIVIKMQDGVIQQVLETKSTHPKDLK